MLDRGADRTIIAREGFGPFDHFPAVQANHRGDPLVVGRHDGVLDLRDMGQCVERTGDERLAVDQPEVLVGDAL